MAKKKAQESELVMAKLMQKQSHNHPVDGLVYSDKDMTELKPLALVEAEYVEMFNEQSRFGKIYVIDEEATEKANKKLTK